MWTPNVGDWVIAQLHGNRVVCIIGKVIGESRAYTNAYKIDVVYKYDPTNVEQLHPGEWPLKFIQPFGGPPAQGE